ncbi:alpha/beta hydrolase [Schlegelella sp. S2-27]|uniref:Alpha/beta hydrolase n=1 Tax=Caldimonas mangrovi TaxID=2944811 RepID=A0ABT0YPT3_9BURK|nr:alpha/beta fold hydrolase [Caldimonas mangrovi]MCM5680344.1 alpha/beta hydrolase [Caldimonas mangrovi]
MFRALSDRLAREGCDVLRFDYHGTGDSAGDEGQQSIERWTEDVIAAHEVLCEAASQRPVHWFGMGLGANMAARAAGRARIAPSHAVLWEPVLNGQEYLDALLSSHRSELSRELGLEWNQLRQRGREQEPSLPGVVLGFEVGEALFGELQRLEALPLHAAARRGVKLTCAVHAQQREALQKALGSAVRLHTVETRTNWMSTEALGTAIVPQDVPRILLETLQ